MTTIPIPNALRRSHDAPRRAISCLACILLLACALPTTTAQDDQPTSSEDEIGVSFGEPVVQRWQVGAVVEAVGGPVQGLIITVPVPTDWPEQQVKLVDEDISNNVRRTSYRVLDEGVKQMVLSIPRVNPGDEVRALLTFEVSTTPVIMPPDTTVFEKARRAPREVRRFVGTSPFINSRHASVRRLERELEDDNATAWEQVEIFYDWVRANIEEQPVEMKGAVSAIRDGNGNGEDLVNVFIALCRTHGIPARTVWVQGHFYAEFFLIDAEGEGHWFPCQLIGNREFGSMSDVRVVLQKGENIRVPEKDEPYRYVPELVKGERSAGSPRVRFVRELLPDE